MSNTEEKSVIIKILALYLLTTAIFLSILFGLYYDRGYGLIIHEKANDLREDFVAINRVIDKYGKFDTATLEEIKTLNLNTDFMISDKQGNVLYNHLDLPKPSKKLKKNGIYVSKGYIVIDFGSFKHHKHHKKISPIPPSFGYKIVMKGDAITPEIWGLRVKTAGFLLLCLLGVGLIAYFLLKLSLKPLQDKITFLDRFIKDTTHEINTPVSVILMSIERLNPQNIPGDDFKKINRIHIAAKTIASIYQNLVLHSFSPNTGQKNPINIQEILEQRLEFFTPLFAHKNLKIQTFLHPATIEANKDGVGCIIDNLLSNAVKYNKKGGEITIRLEPHCLSIQDSGCGMSEAEVHKIFERYARCNPSQGGFGIGLSLVGELCKHYGIEIKCQSEIGKGSAFLLRWQKA
ncbi:HAMP domain-containing sensor histidine kinase [Helicobacter sp. 11S02596-1]|uniref:sensor histidine kinase n=1 Tax=Helicobacter sp. 11S02596-1 TaxID=1476194 RepID=UPI000BDC06E0|nr:HAMP domain-containing sensor histidine kinase [Helicobacter sp. 11S02596-1]PAF45225.1 hypothetical protein BJI48_01315 [Helicobacter sp. 11S02596-1]